MKVIGLDKLSNKFRNLKGIKPNKSLLAGAYVLQRYSMQNAPVDTGFLRSSHHSEETEKGAEMEVSAHYAIYQELGTSRMPAHPFVRPAIDTHEKDILKAIEQQLQKDIDGATK